MKKVLISLMLLTMVTPAFAMTDNEKIQKQEQKYQLKIEKIKKQQELNCIKHPESCNPVSPAVDQKLTLGVVQKDIKIGTSQAEVAAALGSPNIVTKDSDGKDTWIYDKIATISSYNNSGFSVNGVGLGGGHGISGLGGGLLGIGYGRNGGNVQTSQKTLTVVIKFNNYSKVESFTYHMSSF